jgi:hypothetical protein
VNGWGDCLAGLALGGGAIVLHVVARAQARRTARRRRNARLRREIGLTQAIMSERAN